MKKSMILVLVLVALCAASAYAGYDVSGISITASYSVVPEGYRYYFTVNNYSYAGYNLHVWSFDVSLLPAADITSPPNWSAWVFSPHYVVWSTGPSSGDWWKGVPPGQSLLGFEFTSPTLPSYIQYGGFADNASGGEVFGG